MNVRPALFRLALLALALLVAGCPTAPPRELRGSGQDMFSPDTLRIHPLTRLVPGTPAVVETRLEFTDQFGDITKTAGTVDLELLAPGNRSLGRWTFDLSAPAANKAFWDPITRTYLFRLNIPDAPELKSGQTLKLNAETSFPNATRLTAGTALTYR